MKTAPTVRELADGGKIWGENFGSFEATVYVPANELRTDVFNYGFIAPYLLIFDDKNRNEEEAVVFAKEKGFAEIAASFGSSVVFIRPTSQNGWKDTPDSLLADIVSNSRIHQYYKDGYVIANNRFTKQIDGYFIRGAIFRMCLYGFGESADYIAENCIRHFEGDGLWGRSDLAPVVCTMTGLSVMPKVGASDIPVVSVGNSDEVNDLLDEACDYLVINQQEDYVGDCDLFCKNFRRMVGQLEEDPDLIKDGFVYEPGVATVKTSPDNLGDDKDTETHEIGYFACYNSDLTVKKSMSDTAAGGMNAKAGGKVPLLMTFHGGGDSALYIAYMSGWASIAHKYGFLLVSIENHLNSTATEMKELIEFLKGKYEFDETRIYVSGFSMGGCKSWDMIQEYPNLIAAAAPMDATFDVGCNSYGAEVAGGINMDTMVPVFYTGGAITPLPELPFQAQKCFDRMEYVLKLNKVAKPYNVKFDNQEVWENRFWGINGDRTTTSFDENRQATLTLEEYLSEDGNCYTVMGTIDNQGHECRQHTCDAAWQFLSKFRRVAPGEIEIIS